MAAIKEVRPRKIMFFKCIKDKILLFCHLRTCSPYLASLRWIVWGSGSASPQPEPFFPKSIFHCSIVKLTNTHCCVMESTIYTINTKKEVDIFVLSHCWPFPPWDNFQQSPYSEGQSQSTYRRKWTKNMRQKRVLLKPHPKKTPHLPKVRIGTVIIRLTTIIGIPSPFSYSLNRLAMSKAA